MEILANRIKELRYQNNLSQRQLSDYIGATNNYISLIENNTRDINIKYLVKLADFFNVSTDFLLGISENKNNDEIEISNKDIYLNTFLETLCGSGLINDPDEISPDMEKWIMQAVKMQIKFKNKNINQKNEFKKEILKNEKFENLKHFNSNNINKFTIEKLNFRRTQKNQAVYK